MSTLFQILCVAIDGNLDEIKKRQIIEMNSLIGGGRTSSMQSLIQRNFLRANSQADDICQWIGVSCNNDGLVQTIVWAQGEQLFQEANLAWLPRTVTSISIENSIVEASVETRFLPKHAFLIHFNSDRLWGEIELRTLPEKLAVLDMHHNFLQGVIRMTHLPLSIHNIDLSHNNFSMLVVDNENLPVNFQKLLLNQIHGRSLKTIVLNGGKVDSRVLFGPQW